ncbi:MAG TPA: HAMP domain-containing sensor histidine kinase [Jiangellales bacterium]|nr:HAMP domain-containing sensor histidine kinase [Jiangellales bacterium]
MRRPGLGTKVTAGFAGGALVICTAMALLSYDLTRRSLTTVRESNAVRAAYVDTAVVHAGLGAEHPDIVEVLRSLDTGSTRRALLRRDGRWYARNADAGLTAAIPAGLQQLVSSGQPAVQRVRTGAGPALVIGVPLPDATEFYVIDSLQELDRTLRVLSLVLTLVAVGTTAAGAALGFYVTRRVLRPLAGVTATAQHIVAGDLTARLDPAAEPELKQLTTVFNRMVDQLSLRIERDRRFAADVSHELRSPLQTLAAAASVLTRRRDSLDDRTARAVDLISGEVTRFQTLVTDLLELARSDQPPERALVDVAELSRQVCRAKQLPSGIVTVAAGLDPTWQVDRRRMEQVLANLVDNACRYGGGPVAIRLSRGDRLRYLDVDDDGPGVSPRDRETIFDRFVRGQNANSRGDNDGAGLGLALVVGHITAHGGRVYVTDRPGGGARFRIELPEDSP